jgi:hypothetical protein
MVDEIIFWDESYSISKGAILEFFKNFVED